MDRITAFARAEQGRIELNYGSKVMHDIAVSELSNVESLLSEAWWRMKMAERHALDGAELCLSLHKEVVVFVDKMNPVAPLGVADVIALSLESALPYASAKRFYPEI